MPGSSTTPGRPGTRAYAPVRIAFRLRNSVGTRNMNLYEAQWLAYVLPYRRFAAALTDGHARLGVDVDRYSVIASDLHRLLVAGLPAHCERIWTLPKDLTLSFTRRVVCSIRISSAMLVRDRRTSIPCGFGATYVAKPPRLRRLGFLPRGTP